MIEAVSWNDTGLTLVDQTKLPEHCEFIQIGTIEAAFDAIRTLKVRGAPAIGITAAYGLFLGMQQSNAGTPADFFEKIDQHVAFLSGARPTAVNLFWALDRLRNELRELPDPTIERLNSNLLGLAKALHDDDRNRCDQMADFGATLISQNAKILTHCNTGALATGGIGTALGVIYRAHQQGKNIQVFADETRPVLQGARLTVWELHNANIPVTLICDSMGAFLMQQKKVDAVILGADRIAADGSVANKIGTYNLAVLAKHHGVPFYVAAPLSTFDMAIKSGVEIPIEERNPEEIRRVFNQTLITVPDVSCWNPAFDITPPELVTAIITEKGVIRPPFEKNIASHFKTES